MCVAASVCAAAVAEPRGCSAHQSVPPEHLRVVFPVLLVPGTVFLVCL